MRWWPGIGRRITALRRCHNGMYDPQERMTGMSDAEKQRLEDELEEMVREVAARKPACPVDRKEREACVSCEG